MIENNTTVKKSKKVLEKTKHLEELKSGLESAIQQETIKYNDALNKYHEVQFELRHLSEEFIRINELKTVIERLNNQLNYVNILLSDVIYANVGFYTDIRAYEVIKMKSTKQAIIRRLNATMDNPEEIADSISDGIVDNSVQRWNYSVDETGEILEIEQRKNGGWYTLAGKLVTLSKEPMEFYDFNV